MSPKPNASGRTSWQKRDESEIREALQEATVDAYDECEQHTALLTAIEDELAFPFSAQLLGAVVQVTGIEWPGGDPFGLDLVAN